VTVIPSTIQLCPIFVLSHMVMKGMGRFLLSVYCTFKLFVKARHRFIEDDNNIFYQREKQKIVEDVNCHYTRDF